MGRRGPKKGYGGRPLGSGLGKYCERKAKTPSAVRKYWREQYQELKQKKKHLEV